MFQQLNEQEGLTIIIVTHDESVARHAKRIIRMKDGVIVGEGAAGASRNLPQHRSQHICRRRRALPLHDFSQLKHIARTARMALRALRRNIMRSALTCLGIIIGIAAVIAMMEIGGGSSRSIQQAICQPRREHDSN